MARRTFDYEGFVAAREAAHKKQVEIAGAVGCSQGHLSRIECGRTMPSEWLARVLSQAVGKPAEYFLMGSGAAEMGMHNERRTCECTGQDVKGDHLVVSAKRSTSEPWRVVPVSEGALDALGKRGKGCVFGRKRKGNWCKLLSRATRGLPVFGERTGVGNAWHLLRSTWAVNMARQGATLWQLMARGGWTSPQTVMRYINIARAGQ